MLIQLLLSYQKRAAKLHAVQEPMRRKVQSYQENISRVATKLKEGIGPRIEPLEQDLDEVKSKYDKLFSIFLTLQSQAGEVLETPKRSDEVLLTPDDSAHIQDMMYKARMEAEAISNYLEEFQRDLDIIKRSLSSLDLGTGPDAEDADKA